MRNVFLIIVAALIVVGFLFFMTTYTVPFTDVAIVTTFGKASDTSRVQTPGLKFKWPAPIQSTTVYDNRVRLLRARDETQQTADQRQIVVGAFLTWRIADPLSFYKHWRGEGGADPAEQYRRAERAIQPLFRSAMSEVSRFTMQDLFSPDGTSKIPQLEQAILDRLRSPDDSGQPEIARLGIEVQMVGISSIELPADTTTQTFDKMKKTRERLAAEAESEGDAVAAAIKTGADDDAQKILSFAGAFAAEILARGDRESAKWLKQMNEEPQLAAFLERIDLMRRGFGKRVTLVFNTKMMGFELFDPFGIKDFFSPKAASDQTQPPATAETPSR